ncbi:MAG: phage protein Gp36 family protein [Kofleriaceae bacterium]
MASVYTTEEALTLLVGATRLSSLLDRDGDGSADAGVLDATIEKAGRMIDRRLKQRYGSAIPFAQITDSDPTPEEIQEVANDMVLYLLYRHWEPDGLMATDYRRDAFEALESLRKGEDDVDGVARASGSEAGVIAVYDADTPTYAGLDADNLERTRGI